MCVQTQVYINHSENRNQRFPEGPCRLQATALLKPVKEGILASVEAARELRASPQGG